METVKISRRRFEMVRVHYNAHGCIYPCDKADTDEKLLALLQKYYGNNFVIEG